MLADRLHLVGAVAEMRWREWGDEPGREELSWWVDVTAAEAGQRGLPVTWVAVNEGGEAAGAVGAGGVRHRRAAGPFALGAGDGRPVGQPWPGGGPPAPVPAGGICRGAGFPAGLGGD